jgi:hypothetical protein
VTDRPNLDSGDVIHAGTAHLVAAGHYLAMRNDRDRLLEACKYMHRMLVDRGHGGLAGAILGANAIARAEAAIAKAENR